MTDRTSTSQTPLSVAASPAPLPGFPAVDRLLESQRKLYEDLDHLSASQALLIDQERTDELLAVLGQRQALLTRIQVINDSIAPARARWQEFLGLLDPSQRQRVGIHVDAITRLIETIAERDRLDRERMQGARDRVAQEIAGMDRTRRAEGAYRTSPGGPSPLFQDRQA